MKSLCDTKLCCPARFWRIGMSSFGSLWESKSLTQYMRNWPFTHLAAPHLSLDMASTLPTSVKALIFLNCCSQKDPSSKMSGLKMEPACPLKKSNSEACRKDGITSPVFCAFRIQCLEMAMAMVRATGVLPAPGSPWNPMAFSCKDCTSGAKAFKKRMSKSNKVRGHWSCTWARTPSLERFLQDFSTRTGGHLYTGESGLFTWTVTHRSILFFTFSLGPCFTIKSKPKSHSSADLSFSGLPSSWLRSTWLRIWKPPKCSKIKCTHFLTDRTLPSQSMRRGEP